MEVALITIEKIIGLFIILFIGFIALKVNVLDSNSSKRLTDLLIKIVQPCTLFMSYQIDFDRESLIGLGYTALLGASGFIITIILATIIIPAKDNREAAIERVSVVFSNAGFIGLPLVSAIVGSEGVFYLTAYLTMYHLFFWTYAYSMIAGAGDLKTTVKHLIQPCTVAIALGFVCFIFRIHIPQILAEPISTVGNLNTALAMIIAGSILAESDIMDTLKRARPYFLAFLKLMLFPAIMIIIFRFIPLPLVIRTTVIIAIACPTGSMGTMVAVQTGHNGSYSSLLFTMTTLLSLITIPCMVFFMTLVM